MITTGYKTIKSQNLLFLGGVVVKIVRIGGVEVTFLTFEEVGVRKIEQMQTREKADPNSGHFLIT